MNTILLISTSLLAFAGFTFAFYGTLSQTMIDNITRIGMDKGIDSYSDEGAQYYARQYEKWKAGTFFISSKAITYGIIIVLIAIILNILGNSWWSSIIILIIGYILYLSTSKIIGWRVQFVSLLVFLLSLAYSIYLII